MIFVQIFSRLRITIFEDALFPCPLQRVSKVVGLELCEEAVEDAKVNRDLNGKFEHYPPPVLHIFFTMLSSETDSHLSITETLSSQI